MTDIPPSDPRSSQRRRFDYDELIGIFVAFAAIGGILFWVLWRRLPEWDWTRLPTILQTQVAKNSNVNNPNLNNSNLNNTDANRGVSIPIPGIGSQTNPVLTTPSQNQTQTQEHGADQSEQITGTTDSSETEQTIIASPEQRVPVIPIVPPLGDTPNGEFQVTTPVTKMPTIPPARAFTDVPDNFWARRFIDALSSRSVIKGFEDYSFRPNQKVNRAEFAAILQQAFDKPASDRALKFSDISGDFWATGAIDESVAMGFLSGYKDKSFKPGQPIPRVQVIVALVSGLGNLKPPANPAQVLSIYKDAKDIPKYAVEKVAIATANGLVVNHPDPQAFAPNQEATRAEVAVMIHQTLVRMGRLPAIESQNIVRPKR